MITTMEVMNAEFSSQTPQNDEILKNDIIEFIAHDSRPYFESQQMGDPDLTTRQKRHIATELFKKSKCTFLSRFGLFLTADHLLYFENNRDGDRYETDFILRQIRRFNIDQKRSTDIRNRRYKAMKKLISENVYFTESEMMSREPLLYEQLVGRYLSEKERQEHKNMHSESTSTVVNILLNGIEQNRIRHLKQLQFENEEAMIEEEEEEEGNDTNFKTSTASLSQWGDLNDEKPSYLYSSSCPRTVTTLTTLEKNLLKEEFISTMYTNFLDGKDTQFDYTVIDFNTDYDNIDIRERDEEEKYFDSEEPDVVDDVSLDTEDELDLYMRHLELHSSLRK